MIEKRTLVEETLKKREELEIIKDSTSKVIEVLKKSDKITDEMNSELKEIGSNLCKKDFEYFSSYKECIAEVIVEIVMSTLNHNDMLEVFENFLDELNTMLTHFNA